MRPSPSPLVPLPIDPLIPRILSTLEAGANLVLQASPGSGKTTRVPPAILRSTLRRPEQEVLVLEPRRLAAKYAARRVSEELRSPLGEMVGYQFRFENVTSVKTRLRFLTEGMLMRRLMSDPKLKDVCCVVLDEFHERHLHTDLALGAVRRIQKGPRPDLKIVVMSATLDTEAISDFLGGAPILEVSAPVHPVTIEYLPSSSPNRSSEKPLELLVRDAVRETLARAANQTTDHEGGDILVFLPGMAEIRRSAQALAEFEQEVLILPLHGDLTREEQDRAIQPAERTKVILSTNVAETSLTIPGVTTVIDSGLHRQASFSWWSGVPALRTRPISKASAIQRAGRAGRTAPGRCKRLYSQNEFQNRPAFDTAEIHRADLSQTVLELKELGIVNPGNSEEFPWFEAPPCQSLQSAESLLHRLGALSAASHGALTEIGKRMVRIPAHPRVARMLIEAARLGVLEDAASLGALLHEGALDRLEALECVVGAARDPYLRRTREHLLSSCRADRPETSSLSKERRLPFCVLTGFPDRVAQKKKPATGEKIGADVELLFSSGGSSRLPDSGALRGSDTFVILDVMEPMRVRSLVPIDPEMLFDLEPIGVREIQEIGWDSTRSRTVATSRIQYDELILTEERSDLKADSLKSPLDLEQALRVVLKAVFGLTPESAEKLNAVEWVAAFSKLAEPEAIESVLARIALLRTYDSSSNIPDPEATPLWPYFKTLIQGKVSLSELKEVDWPTEISFALAPSGRFNELVPEQIQLQGPRRPKVHYRLGKPPWIESRLQDFFGMKKGPAILGGRLPLTLHLLAPNHRAVQITTDLAGFWERGYSELRRQLSRRYPRHAWPEDPVKN